MGMDKAALQAQQAPLKQQYAENAASALVTLSSTSTLEEGDGVACSLSVGKALKKAGLHAMAGGTDTEQLCSGDMLLESLVACTGVTLKAVATSLDIPVKKGAISTSEERWASTSRFPSASSRSGSSSTSSARTRLERRLTCSSSSPSATVSCCKRSRTRFPARAPCRSFGLVALRIACGI